MRKECAYNRVLRETAAPLQMIVDHGQGILAYHSSYGASVVRGSPYSGMTVKQSSKGAPHLDKFNSPSFIKRLQDGDDYAFRELSNVLVKRIANSLFIKFQKGKYPLSKSDAEDLAQDTMLRISREMREGGYIQEPNAKFTTWIYGIAHNLACTRYNQLKRLNEVPLSAPIADDQPFGEIEKRKIAGSGNETEEDIASPWSDPTEKLHIEQVLQTLKEKYRNVLIWVYWDGYTPEEIAERVGVRINTVHKWLSRAREQFQEAYAKL
jgi:RNA polymerase sigma-70 factor (ECF subfamily)